MIRTVLSLFAVALVNLAICQVKPDASKDSKQMPAQQATLKPSTGQTSTAGASLTTIPAGKCCKVNIAYPSVSATSLSDAKTTSITNAIPNLTKEECAKNTCKIEITNAQGVIVTKGWTVVLDKNNNPTIDARTLPKGKYKVKFISGDKKAEKSMDF